jgi:hypothetical protein
MTFPRAIVLSLLSFAPLAPGYAQDADTARKNILESCEKYRDDVKKSAAAVQGWPMAAKLAADLAERYCSGALTAEKLSAELFGFLMTTAQELETIGISQGVFPFRSQLAKVKPEIEAGAAPSMAPLQPAFGIGLRFNGPVTVTDVPACDKAVAAAGEVKSKNCKELLEHYQAIYATVQHFIQRAYTKEVSAYLDGIAQRWEDFLTKSRSQTALELAVNSYLWRGEKTSGMFLEPPTWQLVLLHPSVVLEYVDKALDGNRSEEGLMLEVLGANWWRNKNWYVPTGASYVLVYSDRAGLPDWANGIAVYFDSKYVLGATRRDGNTGYFISVDLLELYKDKKKTLDKYTRNLPAPR